MNEYSRDSSIAVVVGAAILGLFFLIGTCGPKCAALEADCIKNATTPLQTDACRGIS